MIRYGAQLISENKTNFEDMMTAILTLMLGALGLGQAFADIGDQKAGLLAASRIFQVRHLILFAPSVYLTRLFPSFSFLSTHLFIDTTEFISLVCIAVD